MAVLGRDTLVWRELDLHMPALAVLVVLILACEYPYNGEGYDGEKYKKHWNDGPTIGKTVWDELIIEYSYQPVWYIETEALN